jgi:hypothetical protein
MTIVLELGSNNGSATTTTLSLTTSLPRVLISVWLPKTSTIYKKLHLKISPQALSLMNLNFPSTFSIISSSQTNRWQTFITQKFLPTSSIVT